MKKTTTLFLALMALFVASVNAQFVPDTVKVSKASVAPEIDGSIDDVWETVEAISISHYGNAEDGSANPTPEEEDFTASFKLLWDNEYIYFLGIIVDDLLTTPEEYTELGTEDWEVDTWEVYWSPSNSQKDDMSEMTQVRLSYANAGNANGSEGVTNGWSEDGFSLDDFVTAQRLESKDGWVLEAKFDLEAMTGNPDFTQGSSTLLGCNFNACDNDEELTRKHIGSWIKGAVWNKADTAGVVELVTTTSIERYEGAAIQTLVYPNPSNSVINIQSSVPVDAIEIIDITGSIVKYVDNFNGNVDVSELVKGLYVVRVFSNGQVVNSNRFVRN